MRTYLDHAATSPLCLVARERLVEALEALGNPSASHRSGQLARRRLEEAREELADAVGAAPSEVVFTSGGSEADSLALLGSRYARPERPRLLISAVEHAAVAGARRFGAEVLPVDGDGHVLAEGLGQITDDVTVVSIIKVGNETGVVQDLDPWVERAHGRGAWVHTDAVQALGHVPVDFRGDGVDLMSLSAHKVGGPVGIGALLVRRGVTLAPAGLGGEQEGGIRSGTQSVALATAFAAAASQAVRELADEAPRLAGLRDRIRDVVAAAGGVLNGAGEACHIVNASFPGARSQELLLLLDQAGIDASAGSACRAGVSAPSDVLLAMGLGVEHAGSALRFSIGRTSTATDVARLAAVLPGVVERSRAGGH